MFLHAHPTTKKEKYGISAVFLSSSLLLVAGLEALSHFTNCVERSFPESLMCNTYRVHTFSRNGSFNKFIFKTSIKKAF